MPTDTILKLRCEGLDVSHFCPKVAGILKMKVPDESSTIPLGDDLNLIALSSL